MKTCNRLLLVLLSLCLVLSFSACGKEPSENLPSPQATTPSAPIATQPTQTTPPPSEPDLFALYEDACQSLNEQANIVARFDVSHDRTVSDQLYGQTTNGEAFFAGLGTEEMEALIKEELSFSGMEKTYYRSYIGGKGYCRVDNYNFQCKMTAEEFMARQLPFLNTDLYELTTGTVNSDGTATLSFTNASQVESFVENYDCAQLTEALGTVTLNEGYQITGITYYAEYTVGNACHVVDMVMTIETPDTLDLSAQQPAYSKTCPSVSDLSIPRRMLQVVGDLYATDSISASYTDSLYSAAFGVVRSQSGNFHSWGRNGNLLSSMDTQVVITDYTGTSNKNTQTISYQNGLYSYATNGGEETVVDTVKPEDVRIQCEDAILSSLFELSHVASATMEDTGDFLRIRFDANEDFTEELCDSIYGLFQLDLDDMAEEFTTDAATGYLYINQYTGLPTSLGIALNRTHTIAGASYDLAYQLDQSMELPSGSAYTAITGQAQEPTAETPQAKPLFYKVTNKKGKTLWLLGTIHAGDLRTGNLPKEIMDAFAESDALAVEFDSDAFQQSIESDPQLLAALTEAYYYSDDETYKDHLKKDLRKQLQQLIYASGNNNASVAKMKVGILHSLVESFYLQQGSNLSADMGMDTRLLQWARAQKKPIYEIESGLEQIQLIAGFSDKLQSLLLQQTLDTGVVEYGQELQELYELWCQGDEAALSELLAADTSDMSKEEKSLYKEYYKAMFTDRNKAMHKAAVKYLKGKKTVFYAVGLAHLLGEDGLVASLRDAGYTVELVTYE